MFVNRIVIFANRIIMGALSLGLLAALVGQSQPLAAAEEGPLWLRYPAVSPDGSQVAFAYRGQIWLVPAGGGEARPLTAATAYAKAPVWSPDGTKIAFASTRHGNPDVFVMPAAGGPVRRLTYHSGDDLPMAFSPDGREVYFSSNRIGDPKASGDDSIRGLGAFIAAPHAVPVEGGRVRRLWPTGAAEIAPHGDGQRFLYADDAAPIEDPWRKHQVSAAAQDLWLYDAASGTHRQLTVWRGEDRDPSWTPDGAMVWLSERGGNFNVWRRPLEGGEAEQLTAHATWPVRFLSAADDGTLVYAWNGALWRLQPGGEPKQIAVTIRQGDLVGGRRVQAVNGQASELVVSPDGSEVALIARGEVFVVSTATGATRRITDTPGLERYVSFAPDGRRLVYASERDGSWDIVEASLLRESDKGFSGAGPLEEKVLVGTEADEYQPAYAPDGKRIAYFHDRTELRVFDSETGTSITVLPAEASYSYYDGDRDFAWSPDGKWIAGELGFGDDIALIDAAGEASPVNISLNGFSDSAPQVSADGAIVLWITDRFGLRAAHGSPESGDIFAAFLTAEAYDAFRGVTGGEAPTPAAEEGEGEAVAESRQESPFPDLEGIEYRSGQLTPFSSKVTFFQLSPDNKTLYFVVDQPNRKTVGFALDTATSAMRTVFTRPTLPPQAGATVYAMDPAGRALFVLAGGSITRYDTASGAAAALPFSAEVDRDGKAEVAALFDHAHRMTAETFYAPDMHGKDWQAIGAHYRRFVPHIVFWEDMVELLAEMVGELNASHQGVRYHASDPTADDTASLGLYYDDAHRGPGMKIAEVLAGGPSDHVGSALQAGAVILAVDGRPITPEIDIHRLLNRKAGKEVLLEIAPAAGGEAVLETVKPQAGAYENEYAYRRWVAQRRALVEELSGGRLGYVHVRGMNLQGYQAAYGETFGRHKDKEGMLIDVRANGGGNLHDQLVTMLTGSSDSANVSRQGNVITRNPRGRWTKPSAVISDENSYSDGSVFPTLYQVKGIGPVIGAPVPGTGTAVVRPPLIEPKLVYGIPELGFRLNDGRFFENLEVQPDLLVLNDPESIAAGRDLQLEAAVEHLLGIIDAR